MSFARYIRDKAFALAMLALVLAFLTLALVVFGYGTVATAFIDLVVVLAAAAALVYDYLLRRSFYQRLYYLLRDLDQPHLIAELLDRPAFFEGRLDHDALRAAGKSMNDIILRHRRASEEYRDYLETWVHEIKTPLAACGLILENNKGSLAPSLSLELARVEAFVDQALYYARSATLEKDYLIQKVSLGSLVKSALQKRARLLIEAGMALDLEGLPPDLEVLSDPKWLDFILGQIIANAVAYRKPQPTMQLSQVLWLLRMPALTQTPSPTLVQAPSIGRAILPPCGSKPCCLRRAPCMSGFSSVSGTTASASRQKMWRGCSTKASPVRTGASTSDRLGWAFTCANACA
jgi:signal transduction histidine kinase